MNIDLKGLVTAGRRLATGVGQQIMNRDVLTLVTLCDVVDAFREEESTLRTTLAAREAEVARLLQSLTDEQAAHKLTAETLAKAIRDGDKAEQYRVERDRAWEGLRTIATLTINLKDHSAITMARFASNTLAGRRYCDDGPDPEVAP